MVKGHYAACKCDFFISVVLDDMFILPDRENDSDYFVLPSLVLQGFRRNIIQCPLMY